MEELKAIKDSGDRNIYLSGSEEPLQEIIEYCELPNKH
jgi:hypothetical protein